MNNKLLFYYQQELALVHQLAEEFAKAHPKIAGRLRLDGKNSADPETARLFQTFALSNARLSYDLEDDFSFLGETLLNTRNPHLYAPLPAFSIIRFQADPIKLNHQLNLSKHLLLQSATKNGEHCFFRTCYDVEISPIKITEVELVSKPVIMPTTSFLNQANAFLRIRLESVNPKIRLAKSDIKKLRFFINLPAPLAHKLYALIFNHCLGIIMVNDFTASLPIILPLSYRQPVGFQPEHDILPYRHTTDFSYHVLLEYFAFPEKFLFFDINHLPDMTGDGAEIIFYLDQSDHHLEKIIKSDHLKLFCTPVINLFDAETARIEIKPTQQKYVLPTDKHLEIYRVNKTTVYFDDQQEKTLEPIVLRKPSWEAGEYLKSGSESFLYFQAQEIQKLFLENKNPHINSKVLCTNRDLPAQLDITDKNMVLQFVENKTDVLKKICFLKKISPSSHQFLQPGLCWQTISTLHPNCFSLTNDQEGLDALRNVLANYMPDALIKNKEEILSGLLSLRTQTITVRSRRLRENRFCQGIKISLQLDEAKFDSIGVYLFCRVLSYFLSAWFSKNAMIVLVVLSSTGKELYSDAKETRNFASLCERSN